MSIFFHNLVRERDELSSTDIYVSKKGFLDLAPSTSLRDGRSANNIRIFANYFMSPAGSIPWEMSEVVFI